MAEGGGIGPRSSKGTPAYKAGPSSQLGRPPVGLFVVILITARSASPPKEIGTGLSVLAQPHDEAAQRWGRAINILSMFCFL